MLGRLLKGLLHAMGVRKDRWRVQAFLTRKVTQGKEYPYQPSFHSTKKAAELAVEALEQSFPPGDVRIECELISN